jgi:hypothetical protein
MLTENQKQIIESLTSEFSKMNIKSEPKSGCLIDKSMIDSMIDESISKKIEIKMKEDKLIEEVKRIRDADIERLNIDLMPMGFTAKAMKYDHLSIFETSIYLTGQESINHIRPIFTMSYNMTRSHYRLPSNELVSAYSSYEGIKYSNALYENIENLCKSNWFIDTILKYYKK